jgi:uncharacterized protein (TIGR02611 family)
MGFVSDQRAKQIIGIARSHLDPGEPVLAWVRARAPRAGFGWQRSGFMYATPHKLLVYWAGQNEGHLSVPWESIRAWGVKNDASGGPVLGVETDTELFYVQMRSLTRPSARGATDFLQVFASRAPKVRRALSQEFKSERHLLVVEKARRSLAGHTKRVIVTVLGLVLVIVGAVFLVLPGPGLLLLIPGLVLLGSEYDWAEDSLQWTKEKYRRTREAIRERRARRKQR